MEYSKLIAITGVPGLFELVGNKADGLLVKNLDDASIKFVSSRKGGFSQLEAIEIFTIRENVNLSEIFVAMQESTEVLPSEKDAKATKSYFEKVYPDLDFDRVYGSDMKKMVKWFSILKAKEITIKVPSKESGDDDSVEEATN